MPKLLEPCQKCHIFDWLAFMDQIRAEVEGRCHITLEVSDDDPNFFFVHIRVVSTPEIIALSRMFSRHSLFAPTFARHVIPNIICEVNQAIREAY